MSVIKTIKSAALKELIYKTFPSNIYIVGIIVGALFLDIWGAETSLKKALLALSWTAIFLIAYFYSDREKNISDMY